MNTQENIRRDTYVNHAVILLDRSVNQVIKSRQQSRRLFTIEYAQELVLELTINETC